MIQSQGMSPVVAVSHSLAPVAIVDGYSSGSLLRLAAAKRGVQTVHVRSTVEDPAGLGGYFNPADYHDSFQHQGDAAATAEWLRQFSPQAVIGGAESGVLLAEDLTHRLGLRGNPIATTLARRSKDHMWERVRGQNVPAGHSVRVTSVEQALEQARAFGSWPVVVKPPTGSGTVGVTFCYNEAEVAAAFTKIFGKINDLLAVNDVVVMQSYLDGPEFAVNQVSVNGQHRVSGIWAYSRKMIAGAATLVDCDELIDFDDERVPQLVAYARQVLDAVQIQNGPSHMELKITSQGVRLVEVAARLGGAGMSHIESIATNRNPVEMTLDAYLNPQALLDLPDGYSRTRTVRSFFISVIHPGYLMSEQKLAELQRLPGVHLVKLNFHDGDVLKRSVDLDTVIGQVILIDDDPQVVRKSLQQIRQWHEQEAFEKAA